MAPLSIKGQLSYPPDLNPYGLGHGVCINVRLEVQAAAQDRTMFEVTHCCGTLDYHKDPILKKNDDQWKHIGEAPLNATESGLNATEPELPELTCLTLAGMIKIFCKYLQEGIVPYEMNLGRDFLAPSGTTGAPNPRAARSAASSSTRRRTRRRPCASARGASPPASRRTRPGRTVRPAAPSAPSAAPSRSRT